MLLLLLRTYHACFIDVCFNESPKKLQELEKTIFVFLLAMLRLLYS